MSRLKRLVHEIHRRSIWQVLAVYLAGSWVAVQVVDALTRTAGLPEWVPPFALVLLIIGFPVVMATAIVQEGMPGTTDDAPERRSDAGAEAEALRGGALAHTGPHASPHASHPSEGPVAEAPAAAPARPIHRLFTWRNAILGGVGAFALLGVSVTAYFLMWSTGVGPVGNLVAQGLIEEGDQVVLADFTDRTGSGLGDVVTEALRVDLQESPILSLVPPARVQEALGRMGMPIDAELTPERARELAIRDGLRAVIQGEVGTAGSGYLLTASIVEPSGGGVMASFRSNAANPDEVLRALERLSRDIREKAGESLRTIHAGAGLERVTTSSLDALRVYAEATAMANRGREAEAIPMLEEAIRLDPDFAMAHRKLSAILGNLGLDPDRMRASATRAYELRDRLTEREWGLAEAYYAIRVENNPDRAIEAWERVLVRYPDEFAALNNMGAAHEIAGRPQEAARALRRLMEADPQPIAMYHSNLIVAVWQLGEREEAWRTFERLVDRFPESRDALELDHRLSAAEREWNEARMAVGSVLATRAGTPGVDIMARVDEAGYLLGLGRVAEAWRSMELASRAALEYRQWEWFWNFVMSQRVWSAWALHHPDPGPARTALREGMALVPLDSLDLRGDAAGNTATLLALLGHTDEADALRNRIEAAFAPEEKGRNYQAERQRYLMNRALGQGDGRAAVEALARMEELRPCPVVCPMRILIGLALELAGDEDRAIEAYEAGLETSPLHWVSYEAAWLPLGFQRLAALHEAQSDLEAAATRRRMLDAYGSAEEPIASRVRAVVGSGTGPSTGGDG